METDLSGLREHKFFKHAIKEIQNHPDRNNLLSIHCAIIVRGGNIISIGINKPKRNRFSDRYVNYENRTIHAECEAIRKARRKTDLRGTKMFVARLSKKTGEATMSRPCEHCQQMIKEYGIKKVVYTTNSGNIQNENVSNF